MGVSAPLCGRWHAVNEIDAGDLERDAVGWLANGERAAGIAELRNFDRCPGPVG
jgi:hypothetical protein